MYTKGTGITETMHTSCKERLAQDEFHILRQPFCIRTRLPGFWEGVYYNESMKNNAKIERRGSVEKSKYEGYKNAWLPEEFVLGRGVLRYEDVEYGCHEKMLSVREDGVDAWGDSVIVPADSFVRRVGYDGNPGKWYFISESETLWLTLIGSKVEYIHIGPDGIPEWYLYKAVEW